MEVFRVAFASCLEEKLYRLIPIIIGTLPPVSELEPFLKAAIESTKCLRFGQRLFWEMVKFAMPEKTLEVEEYGKECDIDMPLLNAW
ncbi:carboxypeptidase N subunit 2 [Trichonephila clavata]|uniref:Carboxypeptidase N subunit 2 n=2 Tax=Trichonephila TaxID=2585208 RepID=A0A8X6KHQ6_TRICU|nr:carboxypeptidase N subunit 2 [Trichonephila clavata]